MSVKLENGIEYEVLTDCLLLEVSFPQLSDWCDELRIACRDMKKLAGMVGYTILSGVELGNEVKGTSVPTLIRRTILDLSRQDLDWIQPFSDDMEEDPAYGTQ